MPVARCEPLRGVLARHDGSSRVRRGTGVVSPECPDLSGDPRDDPQAPVAPDTRPPWDYALEARGRQLLDDQSSLICCFACRSA
eukprot:SAG31_NODE_12460_length_940_cov_1.120095_1_plen_83_part_10